MQNLIPLSNGNFAELIEVYPPLNSDYLELKPKEKRILTAYCSKLKIFSFAQLYYELNRTNKREETRVNTLKNNLKEFVKNSDIIMLSRSHYAQLTLQESTHNPMYQTTRDLLEGLENPYLKQLHPEAMVYIHKDVFISCQQRVDPVNGRINYKTMAIKHLQKESKKNLDIYRIFDEKMLVLGTEKSIDHLIKKS